MSAQDGLGCAISSALFLAALILLPKRYVSAALFTR